MTASVDASGRYATADVQRSSDVGGEGRLGAMLFTLVEPHPGYEVAYNRWYERDHFYAGCMVGPWLFAGRRWVATPDLKAQRTGTDPDLFGGRERGMYLAVYWILDGRHEEHVDWALRQVQWLHANGRMFAERDHVHTLLYRHRWTAAADPDGVPAELALDHPFGGLTASLVPDATPALDAGAALSLGFAPIPLPADAPVTQQGLDRLDGTTMVLSFHPGAPPAPAAGEPSALWRAPFVPTVPGAP